MPMPPPDFRKLWNLGSAFLVLLLPVILGGGEAYFRGVVGIPDLRFFPAALVAAGLGFLVPCFPIGPRPLAAATSDDYVWHAWILVIAVLLFFIGLVVWLGILPYSVKGVYLPWWPQWQFNKQYGAAGSQALSYYISATAVAAVKMVRT